MNEMVTEWLVPVVTIMAIFLVVGSFIVGLGLLIIWFLRRKATAVYEPPALTDWRTTGVVDFLGHDEVMLSEQDNVPAQFVLRIQEQRQVANIAGSPTLEHRWRLATKAEAKDVVQIVAIYRKDK